LRIRDAIEALAGTYGAAHAIVGHSGGCTPIAMALPQLAPPQRLVCFSPLVSLSGGLDRLHAKLAVSPAIAEAHRQRLRKHYGADSIETFSLDYLARHLAISGLIVHDRDDDEVPLTDAQALAQRWPRARLTVTQGLGHYRLLRDPETIEQVVQFIIN
jgi:pimeloyl-ACP methyl ester carboxylesterase